jgi:phage shock protein E
MQFRGTNHSIKRNENMITKALKILSTLLLALGVSHAMADPVWIDVRTVEEYAADHIDGDANIPLAEIDVDALAATYGKDAELMLYCRSGNRAGQAKTLLEAAGFSNVSNAGGIGDVRDLRDIPLATLNPTGQGVLNANP